MANFGKPNPVELEAFMESMKKQESGGNYKAQSPVNSNGRGRATGAYQWLNATWAGYAGYARAMDAPPAVQEARAAQMFSAYYRRYGRFDLVAVAWFAGPTRADAALQKGIDSVGGLRDVGGASVADYVASVMTDTGNRLKQAQQEGRYNGPLAGKNATDAVDNRSLAGKNATDAVDNRSIPSDGAREFDDVLGVGAGGPGTVGSYTPTAGTVPVESIGDGTLDMADGDMVSAEVEAKYGDLSDEEFLTEVYEDVLGRDADPEGFEFWLGKLGSGTSREEIFKGFYASDEGGNSEPPLLSEVELMIRQKYPDWSFALDNDEVRDILLEAVDPARGLDAVSFQSKIRQTEWWKTTEASQRDWDARSEMDPATAQREIEKVAGELGRRATTLGAQLDETQLMDLAEKVLRFGLTEAEINDSLAATFDAADPKGDVAANLRQARQLAQSYMVNVDDKELIAWAQQVAVGSASPDDLQSRVIELAKAKFNANDHLMKLIDSGASPSTYFSDHQRMIAQELDMSPDQVDMMDPKYSQILSSAQGSAVRPMDLSETRKHIRENSAFNWQQSSTGRAEVSEAIVGIRQLLGKAA